MKRILLTTLLLLAVFPLAACDDNNPVPRQSEGRTLQERRSLVVYASRTGNTERLARLLQKTLGCDIIMVEPTTPYDADYNAMLERSQRELDAIRRGDFPPIRTTVEDLDNYDTIYIGYPIWYGSIATPMQTFLHTHSAMLAGKHVALFATSGSSGIANTIRESQRLCPKATIIDNTLLITSSMQTSMTERLAAWLEEIGAAREDTDK